MGVDNCVSRSMEFTLRPCISPVPSRKMGQFLSIFSISESSKPPVNLFQSSRGAGSSPSS